MTRGRDAHCMTQRTLTEAELIDALGSYRRAMQLYAESCQRQDWITVGQHRDRAERVYELIEATLTIRTV